MYSIVSPGAFFLPDDLFSQPARTIENPNIKTQKT